MNFPDINTGNYIISSQIRGTIFNFHDTIFKKLGYYILKTVNCVKVLLKNFFYFIEI